MDYFLRPKPAYFTIARELLPYTVGMARKDAKTFADESTAAFFTINSVLEIWATNSTLSDKRVTLQVTSFDLGNTEWRDRWETEITLAPNACTEVYKGDVPGQPQRTKESEIPKAIVVSARLVDQEGVVLSRYSNWYVHVRIRHCAPFPAQTRVADPPPVAARSLILVSAPIFLPFSRFPLLTVSFLFRARPEPFKYLTFPPVEELGFKITPLKDGESIELSTEKPMKGIVLDVEGEAVKWSDQAIDLVPGDPQIIKAVGLNGREVKARFLGDGSA